MTSLITTIIAIAFLAIVVISYVLNKYVKNQLIKIKHEIIKHLDKHFGGFLVIIGLLSASIVAAFCGLINYEQNQTKIQVKGAQRLTQYKIKHELSKYLLRIEKQPFDHSWSDALNIEDEESNDDRDYFGYQPGFESTKDMRNYWRRDSDWFQEEAYFYNKFSDRTFLSPYSQYERYYPVKPIVLPNRVFAYKLSFTMTIDKKTPVYQRIKLFTNHETSIKAYGLTNCAVSGTGRNFILERRLPQYYVTKEGQKYLIKKPAYNALWQMHYDTIVNPKKIWGLTNVSIKPEQHVYAKNNRKLYPKDQIAIDGIGVIKMRMLDMDKLKAMKHQAYHYVNYRGAIRMGEQYFWHIKGTNSYIKVPHKDIRPRIFKYKVIHKDIYTTDFNGITNK